MIRGPDGRITRVGYALPRHKAGGDIRLIACITASRPIRKVLAHPGEPLEPPPVPSARASV
jgi:hypothetical protein